MISPRSLVTRTATWVTLVLLSTTTSVAAVACNGYEEFCSRSYSNVSVIGAHDSYGVSSGNLAANQNFTVTTQLNDGIRMLQVQGHMNNNELHLCHTSCALLDAGTFTSYLTTVKAWLDENPNEVVTLLLVNTDELAPSVWAQSYDAANITSYAYTPPSVPVAYGSWPTLQELISSGKRLVSFLAQNADISEVAYLIDEFTNVWETPFDETDVSFPCTVDRGSPSTGKMYIINHFLDVNVTILGETIPVPATSELTQTNSLSGTGSLTAQSDLCLQQQGYLPTFTLVDYYDVSNPSGAVFQYAANLNGVTYKAESVGSSTGASSTSNSAVSSTPLGGSATRSTSAGYSAIASLVAVLSLIVGGAWFVL